MRPNSQPKLKNIGALWIGSKRDGNGEYFKGSITLEGKTVDLLMMYNSSKVSADDNRPHFVLLTPDYETEGVPDVPVEHPF